MSSLLGYFTNTLLNTSEKKIYTKLIRRIYKYVSGNILNDGLVLSKVSFINELLADITGFLLTEKIVYNYAECNNKELLPILQLFYTQYSKLWNIHKSTTLNIDPHIHDKYRVNYVLISSYYYRQMYNIPKEYDNVFI
jgi:predicted metalloendopeptidase